jgi:putative hydrolase of HD superfamily
VDWIAGLGVDADIRARLGFLVRAHELAYVSRFNRLLDGSRAETSAEHSWHLALTALTLRDLAGADVDMGRVLPMLIIHDLVEVAVGDVPIYDLARREAAAANEAAAAVEVFGALPAPQGHELLGLWREFEAAETDEARFARAVDRVQPVLVHAAGDGSAWASRPVTLEEEQAIATGVRELWPRLGDVVDAILLDAVARGYLQSSTSIRDHR